MTLQEKNNRQKKIIDEIFERLSNEVPEKKLDTFLCDLIRKLFKLEMDFYGIKYSIPATEDDEVELAFIYNSKEDMLGSFAFYGEMDDKGQFHRWKPRFEINLGDRISRYVFGKSKENRVNSCKEILNTVFHELKHLRQAFMTISGRSSKSALMYAKESMYVCLDKYAYNYNHHKFMMEAEALYEGEAKSNEFALNVYGRKNYPEKFISRRETGVLLVPGVGIVDRDEFLKGEIDRLMAMNPERELAMNVWPILSKEYNPDFTKIRLSQLITNFKNEINDIKKTVKNREEQEQLITDTKEMYMEIFKNRILDNNPIEIYEAVRDHGQSEVRDLLNTLKENNTFIKRRKLNAIKETRETYDKMTPNEQEHEAIIMNDGCLIDPRNNNGEIIDACSYIESIVRKMWIPERAIKNFLLGEHFYRFLPSCGYFVLKSGEKLSIKDFIEDYLIPKLENQIPMFHGIIFTEVVTTNCRPYYEMDEVYEREMVNKQYQKIDNKLNDCLNLPCVNSKHGPKKKYSFDQLQMFDIVIRLTNNDPFAFEYFLAPLKGDLNGYRRTYEPEQIQVMNQLFDSARILNNDEYFNPKGINYYDRLRTNSKIIEIRDSMEEYLKRTSGGTMGM